MKKSTCLLLIYFILIAHSSSAQGWQWGRKMTTSTPHAESYFPVMTTDGAGNVFCAFHIGECTTGVTTRLGACQVTDSDDVAQLIITKTNGSSVVKWMIGTQHTSATAVSLTTDKDGNLYILGVYDQPNCTLGNETMPGGSVTYPSNCMYFMAMADTAGNIVWIKNVAPTLAFATWVTGKPSEKHYFPEGGIHTDTSGNIYVVGRFSQPTITIGSTTLTCTTGSIGDNIFVAKYDATGNPIWAKNYGGTAYCGVYGTAVDPTGEIYIAGYIGAADTFSIGTHSITTGSDAGNYFAKLDNSGTPVWVINSDSLAYFNHIAIDKSKNAYLTGSYRSSSLIFGSSVVVNNNPGSNRAFLAKFDSSGNIKWLRGTNGNGEQIGNIVTVDVCGHVWMNGNSQATGVFVDTVHFDTNTLIANDTTYTDMPMFIAAYDYSGNILQSLAVPTSGGGEVGAYHVMQGIAIDNKGSFFIAGDWGNWYQQNKFVFGHDTMKNVDSTYSSFFVAKYTYDFSGCFPLSEPQITDPKAAAKLYPNPAHDQLIIHFDGSIVPGTNARIFDITGRLMAMYPIYDNNTVVSVSGFSPGLYQCQIESGGLITYEKFVVNL